MQIQARLKDMKEQVSVNYEFGANLAELTKKFGDEVVFNKALDSLVIDCQSNMRRIIKKGLEHKVDGKPQPKSLAVITKECQDWAATWTPAVSTGPRKSAAEKVGDLVSQMSPEQRADLIKKLTGK